MLETQLYYSCLDLQLIVPATNRMTLSFARVCKHVLCGRVLVRSVSNADRTHCLESGAAAAVYCMQDIQGGHAAD